MAKVKRLTTLPVFPLLFTAFAILALYGQNMQEFTLKDMLPALGIALGCTFFALLLFLLVFRSTGKAATLTAVAAILFFTYGHVLLLIGQYVLLTSIVLLCAYIAVFTIALYLVGKAKKSLQPLTKVLNIVSALMVIVSLVVIVPYEMSRPSLNASIDDNMVANITAEGTLPDIYYLVWDSLPSANMVKHYYDGVNIDQFSTWLTSRGFYVASESHSNYSNTETSLASSLNMEYLVASSPGIDVYDDQKLLRLLPQMVSNNKVAQILKSLGYTCIQVGSSWEITNHSTVSDISFSPQGLTGFPYLLARTSMLYVASKATGLWGLHAASSPRLKHYEDSQYQLNKLTTEVIDIANSTSQPVFVFAHMMIPHGPLVFSAQGEFMEYEPQTTDDIKSYYESQLTFTIQQLETAVDTILANSEHSPVIIIQGDHGVRSPLDIYCFDAMSGEEKQTAFTSILNAYYLPNGCADLLYPSITPVNTFRLIFNCYFHINYTLLSDYY